MKNPFMPSKPQIILRFIVLFSIAANCAQPAPPDDQSKLMESSALGLRAVDLGSPWSVADETPEQWLFTDGTEGALTVYRGEPNPNPNIEQAVRDKLAEFDAVPGGESFGNQQLVAPIGLIYTARGRYLDNNGTSMGELWGFTVHPYGGSLLILRYQYPGNSDANIRGKNLLALLNALEPLTPNP